MSEKLIELSTKKLLKKFGAGGHKPGSGSAAALQGMLSAELLLTVIELTAEFKKSDVYESVLPELIAISGDIANRILPALEKMFQDDSDQFAKTIALRKDRDNESDPAARKKLSIAARKQLKIATEMPFKIAGMCVDLAIYGSVVFSKGFRSARGDSAVAIHGAVAAVGGCLSIIDLNLLTFQPSEWKARMERDLDEVRRRHFEISATANQASEALHQEVIDGDKYYNDIDTFLNSIAAESELTYNAIEQTARGLQNLLWKHRARIWRKDVPQYPIEAISAERALTKVLDYEFYLDQTLGSYQSTEGLVEVAGLIDPKNKIVRVSTAFQAETQNFTIAHELAHALFHKGEVLHRDKPLDSPNTETTRDRKEQQADKFAAYFLLPERQVRAVFAELFGETKIVINEETAFALTSGNLRDFKRRYRNLREISRLIAATTFYGGNPFNSISEIFKVSVETMAIRLEELNLVGA